MTTRTYYAASYPYGLGAVNANTGRPIRVVHQFRTRADRDAWVDNSPTGYVNNAGYRDALRAFEVSTRERERVQWYTARDGSYEGV